MKKILVTGGTGYIGSHTVIELLQQGYEVIVYDNLSNSSNVVLDRISSITNSSINFIQGDIRDAERLNTVFKSNNFDSVAHFAGLKAVKESVEDPIIYYENNVYGTLQLLQIMIRHNVKKLVFSSSATVYGDTSELPFREDMPSGTPTNPYGNSKLIIENLLSDIQKSDKSWRIICLRYFNPVGAHPSGLIGEDPTGIPNNLMPIITQIALGRKEFLSVFGGNYPTTDGSAIRDYIHVVDLAKVHVVALEKCNKITGYHTVNVGTGKGYSVLEVLNAFEKVNKINIPYKIVDKRVGDIAISYADTKFAKKFLSWQPALNLYDMCKDSWNWQSRNPFGYVKKTLNKYDTL